MREPINTFVFGLESNKNNRIYVEITCDRGHNRVVRKDYALKLKECKDCRAEFYKTKEYNILGSMWNRCYNDKNSRYYTYGGRGIKVCDRWRCEPRWKAVVNFLEDMGHCPKGLTLDRIDVNGDYEPSNCRWADMSTQGYNQTLRSTNLSGRTGVHFDVKRNKWKSSITKDNKGIHLGRYDTFEDAVVAREAAELKYFGVIKGCL